MQRIRKTTKVFLLLPSIHEHLDEPDSRSFTDTCPGTENELAGNADKSAVPHYQM